MEDKLVTVAIHTSEKAEMLKKLLQKEGVEAQIHNVDSDSDATAFSIGVRVRIKESDLTKALSIIQRTIKDENEINKEVISEEKHTILIPIDFSDYSIRTCDVAFRLAYSMKAEVTIFHTYYTPAHSNIAILDSTNNIETLQIEKKIKSDLNNLKNILIRKINNGDLPHIKFNTVFQEGVPEEEITKYCKENNPSLVIMGTRGKKRKEQDLIGSVTAEVIDAISAPVFSIPEETLNLNFDEIKNIGFLTNFNGSDLIAFERMMTLMKDLTFKVFFIHIDTNQNKWNEIKLVGIKEYFAKQYPNLETEICLIKGCDVTECLNDFVDEKNIDFAVLNKQKRNLFSRIFNPSVTRKMVFSANKPLLIYNI